MPLGDDELLVFRYTGQGFVPARIEAKPVADVGPITFLGERLPPSTRWCTTGTSGRRLTIPYESLNKDSSRYGLLGALRAESFYPIVQGYKDTGAVGVRMNFSDPVQLNRASLTASYTPAGGSRRTSACTSRPNTSATTGARTPRCNNADFYDLFGPTKTGRKGYVVGVGRTQTLIFDEPRRLTLDLDANLSGNLDQLPEYQNVAVDVDRLTDARRQAEVQRRPEFARQRR